MKKVFLVAAFVATGLSFGQMSTPSGTVTATTNPTTGNIGIGTTTPITRLAIQGDNQSVSVASTAFNYGNLTTALGARFGMWNNTSAAGIKFDRWLGGADGSGNTFHNAYIGQALYGSQYGIDFRTNRSTGFGDATTSRMFINLDGNIGIGTTTPDSRLHIEGDLNSTGWSLPGGTIRRIGFFTTDRTGGVANYGMSQTNNFNTLGDPALNKPGISLSGYFGINFFTTGGEKARLDWNGNFGLGTTTPTERLDVNGNSKISGKVGIGGVTTFPSNALYTNYSLFVTGGMLADEVRVALSSSGTWADYVFAKDYKLKTLSEVESFIKENGHLPNVPSAAQVKEEGINVAQMATIQQEKIEELTLYIIEQNKRIEALEAKMNSSK